MNGWRLSFALAMLVLAGPQASAQQTVQQAREEGKALAAEKRADPALVPTDDAQARIVPGYTGTTTSQSTYFDDPDRLVSDASTAAGASDSYRTVTDPEHRRPTFSAAEIRATTARATAVEQDPNAFLAGESMTSANGSCVPLPPGSGVQGSYEATCNSGTKVDESSPSCRAPLVVEVRSEQRWHYTCQSEFDRFTRRRGVLCAPFDPYVGSGVCREIARRVIGQTCLQGRWPNCTEPGDPIEEVTYSCGAQVPGQSGTQVQEATVVGERRDETMCQAATADMTCELQSETCVDSDPQTRIVGGLPVTRACWNWQRNYSCHRFSQANDCSALEGNQQCTYLRTDCLDDPQAGPCKVSEKVYRCPIPQGSTATDKQYICGNDVYCINGDCEPIVREASTEFKDALVALHAIDQAGKEFDPNNLLVFSGTRDTCHKPVFGLVNCCAGKTSGLLTAAAGGAALAGGPAAIAALATPFLSLFLCSQDEMRLDIKDRMEFCHKVGTWCSSSFLGICTTKKTAYCCFESKLSRILQEQGRAQLGKAWGAPKTESCRGFTIDEFARLDLSKMDFTEVYAEFIDAAKLPDEIQTINDIQSKIRGYYELHGAPRGGQ